MKLHHYCLLAGGLWGCMHLQSTAHGQQLDSLRNTSKQPSLIQDTLLQKRSILSTQTPIQDKSNPRPQQPSITTDSLIQGQVLNENGLPLRAVTIIAIKGKSVVGTDDQGKFSIAVAAQDSIEANMMGYERAVIAVGQQKEVVIHMSPSAAQKIDEVVVIGYGTALKKNLTGSVSSLKGSAFQQQAITNGEEGIAGKIAGVRVSQTSGVPGSAMNIKIRGLNSITASSTPLYVIDGLPQSHMRNVNPRDIASIEVLKDASAAAIYGSRGGNGVIVVTTRSGSAGHLQLEFNSYAGYQTVDKKLPMMNTEEYTNYIRFVRNERFRLTGGDLSAPISSRPEAFQYPDSYANPSLLPNNNWQDLVYRNASMQNYDLNVSGGGEIGTFNISGGYLKQDGVMRYTGFERYNLRANTHFQFSEKFNIGANVAAAFSRQQDPVTEGKESNAHYAIVMPPVVEQDQNTERTGYSQAHTFVNPLIRLQEMTANGKGNNVHINTFAEYRPITSLRLRTQLGYNYHNATYNEFIPFNVNKGVQAQGMATNRNSFNMSIQNTVTYTPDLGSNHYLDVLVGQSFERNNEEYMAAGGNGYPNDLLPWLNNASIPTLATSNATANSIASYFGRVQYHLMDRYLISASARYDGSSRFGQNHKWGLFPSLSAGWKINEENFLKDVEQISLLKVRASWGLAGNDRIGDYEHIALLAAQNYNLNGEVFNGLVPSTIPNDDLSWEKTTSTNIGLDLFLFADRLQFTADAYLNNTTDLLLSVPTTRLSGFSSIRKNIGKVENKGLEFQLASTNIQKSSFTWTSNLNFSLNRNKVLDLGTQTSSIIVNTWGADAFITQVGHPIGSYYMYKTDGLLMPEDFNDQGNATVPIASGQIEGNVKIVDANGDGIINTQDQVVLGNNQPSFLYGISNNITFKGFEFSFDLQGSKGGKIFYQGRRGFDNGVGDGSNQYQRWLYSYKTTEMEASIPSGANMEWDGITPNQFGVNPVYNDTWLYDASFLRIRNITLGYNFEENILQQLRISKARIYLMADNPYTFTKYPGANPEANNGGNESTSAGVDYGSYPISRRFTLGIQLIF
ncbi:TonB-dependent receptor [Sphingobacterium olei]|uniref:TonB-dependent receptor n=1 Tax=Sphingobacterium olei TaxID=2571155 RepID=A0A4U0PJK8_9SPHI|nr:TonB-dependent receptor [Sphingobacterium olei]TJZ63084.1 TonB-dependent receptor [Sphingobacterium olei]